MYLLKLYNMYLAQLVVANRRRAHKFCSTVGLYWNTKLQFCQYKFRNCTSQNITGLVVQDGNLVSCSYKLSYSSELQYVYCCDECVYRSAPTWYYNLSAVKHVTQTTMKKVYQAQYYQPRKEKFPGTGDPVQFVHVLCRQYASLSRLDQWIQNTIAVYCCILCQERTRKQRYLVSVVPYCEQRNI